MVLRDMTKYFSDSELELYYDKYVKVIDGETYYFKNNDTIYNELLVCEIYKLLGLPVVDVELVLVDGTPYIVSKSYRDDENNTYFNGYEVLELYLNTLTDDEMKDMGLEPITSDFGNEYIYPCNSLETVWQALSKCGINSNNIRNLLIGFVKLYSMSIILGDIDLHPGNWEIEINNNTGIARLVPKYDNGLTFCSVESINSFFVDPSDAGNKAIDSLRYFLKISTEEDRDIFNILCCNCHDDLIKQAMKNVDDKYDPYLKNYLSSDMARMSKGYILRRFQKNREAICNLREEINFMN